MSPRPFVRRALAAVGLGLALVGLTATPAAADPPGPTDYRSTIDGVRPGVDTVTASIVGGDGFLLLEVDPGTEVEVRGYSGDPYLRFGADGTVEENQSSPTTYLNETRNRTDASGIADDAEPVWKTVATDGRWAWHDHRIHSMGSVDDQLREQHRRGVSWNVPILVDGEDVVISGAYRLVDAPSPLPWVALAVVLAVVVAFGLTRVVTPLTAGGIAVLLGGIGGVVAGVAQRGESPPGAPTSALVVILPAIALVAGVIVVMQRGRVLRAVAGLAGAASLGGWAVVRIQVLWKAILPTSLSAPTDRALTAVALGAAVGAAIAVVRSGALAPALLDDDEPRAAPDATATVAESGGT